MKKDKILIGSRNNNLNTAKKVKNDEFYTNISDIEREMNYYKDQFRGKVIFSNCDDPEWSHFYKFFDRNFEFLGIKKYIVTHYDSNKNTYAIILEIIDGVKTKTKIDLKQNGDFRSPESVKFLKESDIIITNPPFSLWREYIAQLMEYNKSFIIIGTLGAITYKDVFPLIKNNKLWLASNNVKEFRIPNGEIKKLGMVNWYTNMKHKKRENDFIPLYEKYNPEKYPKYDNYSAINVDKVKEIPKDYYKEMGVPISFILKYNPKQFDILDLTSGKNLAINNINKYRRIIIKRKVTDVKT